MSWNRATALAIEQSDAHYLSQPGVDRPPPSWTSTIAPPCAGEPEDGRNGVAEGSVAEGWSEHPTGAMRKFRRTRLSCELF
jgi:hypothetical protein